MVGYLKNRELYIDSVTNIENIHKLNKDILYKNEPLTFMEIHLDNLQDVNNKFGFANGDMYLKAIAQKIDENLMGGKVYRTIWSKTWNITSMNDNYLDIVEFLRKLEINMNDEKIETTFSIGVAIEHKDKLLKRSSLALNEAMQSPDKLCIKS